MYYNNNNNNNNGFGGGSVNPLLMNPNGVGYQQPVQQQPMYNQPVYGQQPMQPVQPMQQPVVQQPMNTYAANTYKGFMVDPNWIDNTVYAIESPEFITGNSGFRQLSAVMLNDNDLTMTTKKLLNKLHKSGNNDSIRLRLRGDNTFSVDFSVYNDPTYHVRRTYVEKQNAMSMNNNPLIKTIDNLIESDTAYGVDNDSRVSNSYNMCFYEITGKTTLRAADAAELYVNAIKLAISYIAEYITAQNKYVRRDPSGMYVMSSSLYDLLENGNITYAGIKIKPVLQIDNMGTPTIDFMLDFTEEVTYINKADLTYRSNFHMQAPKSSTPNSGYGRF